MNGILIVVLVAFVALLDLFRLRAKNTTLSRAGFLVAALPRALMPVAAAGALGAWTLMKVYEGIAASGSGGIGAVAGGTIQSVRILIAGAVAFVLTLLVAFVMTATRKDDSAGESGMPVQPRRFAPIAGLLITLAALGSGWTAMYWTDRLGVGFLAPLSRDSGLPPAPTSYSSHTTMSGREVAEKSGWVIWSQYVGLAIGGVAVVLCLMTSFFFSRGWSSGAAWTVAGAGTIVLMTVAALYSHHLWTGAGWLQAIMRR